MIWLVLFLLLCILFGVGAAVKGLLLVALVCLALAIVSGYFAFGRRT